MPQILPFCQSCRWFRVDQKRQCPHFQLKVALRQILPAPHSARHRATMIVASHGPHRCKGISF